MGIKFDSKWEAERYGQLHAMEKAGAIKDLQRQVRYNIQVNDQKICQYVADFVYQDMGLDGESPKEIVEDAKGVETPEFKIKKKLMKAVFGIEIKITKKSS
jgi:hypothetical protein